MAKYTNQNYNPAFFESNVQGLHPNQTYPQIHQMNLAPFERDKYYPFRNTPIWEQQYGWRQGGPAEVIGISGLIKLVVAGLTAVGVYIGYEELLKYRTAMKRCWEKHGTNYAAFEKCLNEEFGIDKNIAANLSSNYYLMYQAYFNNIVPNPFGIWEIKVRDSSRVIRLTFKNKGYGPYSANYAIGGEYCCSPSGSIVGQRVEPREYHGEFKDQYKVGYSTDGWFNFRLSLDEQGKGILNGTFKYKNDPSGNVFHVTGKQIEEYEAPERLDFSYDLPTNWFR